MIKKQLVKQLGRPKLSEEEKKHQICVKLSFECIEFLKNVENTSHFVDNAIKKEITRINKRTKG